MVMVRMREARALTLADESGSSSLYVAGDEFDLAAEDAEQLVEQGFVEERQESCLCPLRHLECRNGQLTRRVLGL
jgi:hypothetical protein